MTARDDLARAGRLRRPDPLLPQRADFVLTIACVDVMGIVHMVSGFLFERDCNIVDSAQFDDPASGRFFMRVAFARAGPRAPTAAEDLREAFRPISERYAMTSTFRDLRVKQRLVIMVSRHGHCLNDLLFRYSSGELPVEVAAVISNHPDFEPLAAIYDIPFHCVPVSAQTRAAAEERLLDLVARERVDLVVLARYMQILSPQTCAALAGRAINIHHSFLPSFRGARPYQQAYDYGVKVIGATAHYVTAELDEGPVIEQEVARVEHNAAPAQLAALGRDAERVALARAVRWHAEHRILLHGRRTVIFK